MRNLVRVWLRMKRNFTINSMDCPFRTFPSIIIKFSLTLLSVISNRKIIPWRIRVWWKLWRDCLLGKSKMHTRNCWEFCLCSSKNLKKKENLLKKVLKSFLSQSKTDYVLYFLKWSSIWMSQWQQEFSSVFLMSKSLT